MQTQYVWSCQAPAIPSMLQVLQRAVARRPVVQDLWSQWKDEHRERRRRQLWDRGRSPGAAQESGSGVPRSSLRWTLHGKVRGVVGRGDGGRR